MRWSMHKQRRQGIMPSDSVSSNGTPDTLPNIYLEKEETLKTKLINARNALPNTCHSWQILDEILEEL